MPQLQTRSRHPSSDSSERLLKPPAPKRQQQQRSNSAFRPLPPTRLSTTSSTPTAGAANRKGLPLSNKAVTRATAAGGRAALGLPPTTLSPSRQCFSPRATRSSNNRGVALAARRKRSLSWKLSAPAPEWGQREGSKGNLPPSQTLRQTSTAPRAGRLGAAAKASPRPQTAPATAALRRRPTLGALSCRVMLTLTCKCLFRARTSTIDPQKCSCVITHGAPALSRVCVRPKFVSF